MRRCQFSANGRTEARQIAADDGLAGALGDVLIVGNTAVPQPLRVYHFSVAQTAERDKMIDGISSGKTKKVYASTDKSGTISMRSFQMEVRAT